MISNKMITLLPDLAAFILVEQEKSFTAAAKKLNVTPSALSKTITRLEKAFLHKLVYFFGAHRNYMFLFHRNLPS